MVTALKLDNPLGKEIDPSLGWLTEEDSCIINELHLHNPEGVMFSGVADAAHRTVLLYQQVKCSLLMMGPAGGLRSSSVAFSEFASNTLKVVKVGARQGTVDGRIGVSFLKGMHESKIAYLPDSGWDANPQVGNKTKSFLWILFQPHLSRDTDKRSDDLVEIRNWVRALWKCILH